MDTGGYHTQCGLWLRNNSGRGRQGIESGVLWQFVPTHDFRQEKMNEDRKQQLEHLLVKAMSCLEILGIEERDDINLLRIPIEIDEYRRCLKERWTYYTDDVLPVLNGFSPVITDKKTELKLLDFIRQEFAAFIRDDRILTASASLVRVCHVGYSLNEFLEQLLKIAICRGLKKAVSAFMIASEETRCTYQVIALLEGLELKEDIQPYNGIRLCSNSESDYVRYLTDNMSKGLPRGKTLLVIDCSTSPLFSKPHPPERFQGHPRKMKAMWTEGLMFGSDVNTENPPKIRGIDFNETLFCRALSLACNSPIQICMKRRFLAEDELFNLSDARSILTWEYGESSPSIEAREAEIDKAKELYEDLICLSSNVQKKLQTPINRWIKSQITAESVDAMIDLGIAFESIYLSDIEDPTQELKFRLRLHAALFLGNDEDNRKSLMKEFKEIYNWRSSAVHAGILPKKAKKTSFTNEEIANFLENAQNLCRDSILKIIENREYPDWDTLILGE